MQLTEPIVLRIQLYHKIYTTKKCVLFIAQHEFNKVLKNMLAEHTADEITLANIVNALLTMRNIDPDEYNPPKILQ